VSAIHGPVTAIGLMILFHRYRVVVCRRACGDLRYRAWRQRAGSPAAKGWRRTPVIARLRRPYWFVVAAGTVFTLARFSEAFLIIRAQQGGLAVAWAPAVIAVMSLVFAASAYPAGRLQDKIGARPLLILGLVA
jgi:hypothetical protein